MRNTDKIMPMEGVELKTSHDPLVTLLMLILLLQCIILAGVVIVAHGDGLL